VHVSRLPGDYFYFDEQNYEMVGQSTGMCYKLGMKVKVYATDTDRISRTIDFAIAEGYEDEE